MNKKQSSRARLWNYGGQLGVLLIGAVAVTLAFDIEAKTQLFQVSALLSAGFIFMIAGAILGREQ